MSAIKPGDLVMMVHRICDCPTCTAPLGIPWTVEAIVGDHTQFVRCITSRRMVAIGPVARGFRDCSGHYQIPTSALKKIDPPLAEDDVAREEELHT